MNPASKEPLFTPQEWLIVVSVWFLYAVTLFSMDPEWVGWAAPLAFGGALVAANPPPPSCALSASPADVFHMGFLASLLSVAVLEILLVQRGESGLGWLAKCGASLRGGGFKRRAQRLQHLMPRRNFQVRVLQSVRRDSSIGEDIGQSHPAAQGLVTPLPQRGRIIPRGLREGGPEDL